MWCLILARDCSLDDGLYVILCIDILSNLYSGSNITSTYFVGFNASCSCTELASSCEGGQEVCCSTTSLFAGKARFFVLQRAVVAVPNACTQRAALPLPPWPARPPAQPGHVLRIEKFKHAVRRTRSDWAQSPGDVGRMTWPRRLAGAVKPSHGVRPRMKTASRVCLRVLVCCTGVVCVCFSDSNRSFQRRSSIII